MAIYIKHYGVRAPIGSCGWVGGGGEIEPACTGPGQQAGAVQQPPRKLLNCPFFPALPPQSSGTVSRGERREGAAWSCWLKPSLNWRIGLWNRASPAPALHEKINPWGTTSSLKHYDLEHLNLKLHKKCSSCECYGTMKWLLSVFLPVSTLGRRVTML